MRKEIKMPYLKKDTSSCVLARWACDPGDVLEPGDVMFEAEADKVTEEIRCEEKLTVIELRAEEGDEVAFGNTVAVCEVL